MHPLTQKGQIILPGLQEFRAREPFSPDYKLFQHRIEQTPTVYRSIRQGIQHMWLEMGVGCVYPNQQVVQMLLQR